MFRAVAVAAMIIAVPAAPLLAQSMTGSAYIRKAGASDLYERQSSQLLLQSTQNQELRDFANQMIRDHTKSTADVKAAAARGNLRVLPPALDATGRANMTALRRVSGAERDRLYIDQQKKSHQMAIETHQTYAASGRTPSLKATAAQIVPVVRHHIEMLNAM